MGIIQGTLLPEHKGPIAFQSCRKCDLYKHGTRAVWGEGNPKAPVCVILDNPGAREDKHGRPFLCGTRETLQLVAKEAGLKQDQMYVTFLLKCRPRRAYDKVAARSTCIQFLWQQLEDQKPAIIFCLGNTCCQSLFGWPDAEVKQLRGTIHYLGEYKVIVSYHPLAVRRRPALYKYFLHDWQLVVQKLYQNHGADERS